MADPDELPNLSLPASRDTIDLVLSFQKMSNQHRSRSARAVVTGNVSQWATEGCAK